MIASLDGDGAAYDELLEGLTAHLRAYYTHRFARIGQGLTEVEDLRQESLIAMRSHPHTHDRSEPFTPLIYAIARYKFLDYFRRIKLSFKNLSLEDTQEPTSLTDMTGVESSPDLQRLLSEITKEAREAIQDVKLDRLSVSEAAARSGMSESAIKVAVHRGSRNAGVKSTIGKRHVITDRLIDVLVRTLSQ